MASKQYTDSVIDYNKVDKATIDSLIFYFKDPEWFDKKLQSKEKQIKSIANKYNTIQPIRCIKCDLPFQKLPIHRISGTHVHLNRNLFNGIKLEKGVCHECK
tara:strand:- start:274 stop:579 length:306 start_codon:yes stop_codon:yes gene_type:complete